MNFIGLDHAVTAEARGHRGGTSHRGARAAAGTSRAAIQVGLGSRVRAASSGITAHVEHGWIPFIVQQRKRFLRFVAIDQQARLPVLDGVNLVASGRALIGSGDVLAPEEVALVHRTVALTGQWLPQYTVFLDNRQMNGRPGFFVLTPLQLQDSHAVVLVQRGWVARNFQDRMALPAVDTPDGVVQLQGRVAPAPSKLFELDAGITEPGFSRIRQNLDLETFSAETGLALTRLTVLQTGPASEGLLREWPAIRSGVEKHYGYAFQWFGLSSLVVILYVWFQLVRPFIRARRTPRSKL